MKYKFSDALTLLELSISIIIISILVILTLSIDSLRDKAEISNNYIEAKELIGKIHLFKVKYGTLPGDIPNPKKFLPNSVGYGNGNGKIDGQYTTVGSFGFNEETIVMNHLSNASLVEGSFSGAFGNNYSFSSNIYPSKNKRTGFSIYGTGALIPQLVSSFYDKYNNVLSQGGKHSYGSLTRYSKVFLTSLEAEYLDRKFDDGLPFKGNIRAFYIDPSQSETTGQHLCMNGTTVSATYNVTAHQTKHTCSILYNIN